MKLNIFLNRWVIFATILLLIGVLSVNTVYPVPVIADSPHYTSAVYWGPVDVDPENPPALGDPVTGASSQLVVNNNGVSMNIKTHTLDSGAAYTSWWVVFNEPGECKHGVPGVSQCGEEDLPPFGGDPAVDASTLFAAGHVIGDNGKGNFASRLKFGDTTRAVFGPGLREVDDAVEIHVVVRSHGPPLPGLVNQQISTLHGGCVSAPSDPDAPDILGDPGENICISQQFAVFQLP